MKHKIIIACCALLLIAGAVYARMTVIGVTGVVSEEPSGSCATLAENPVGGSITSWYDGEEDQVGQSFMSHPTETHDLCSITINISTEALDASESTTVTIRVRGGDGDMSSTWDATDTAVVNDGQTGDITFEWAEGSRYNMPANEIQYFIVDVGTATYTDRLEINRSAASEYEDGAMNATDKAWAQGVDRAYDMVFNVSSVKN